jgi:hypothetical protein
MDAVREAAGLDMEADAAGGLPGADAADGLAGAIDQRHWRAAGWLLHCRAGGERTGGQEGQEEEKRAHIVKTH